MNDVPKANSKHAQTANRHMAVWQYSTFLGPGPRNGSWAEKQLKDYAKVRPETVSLFDEKSSEGLNSVS